MQLKCIEQKTTNKYVQQLELIMIAALLSIAVIIWFLSTFDLQVGTAGSIGGGMVRLWNGVCDCLGKSDYVLLTKYSGASDGSGLFLLLMGFLLWAMTYALLRSKITALLLVYVIPFFAVQILWDVEPAAWTCALLLVSILTATFYCIYAEGGSLWSILLIWCIAILVFAGAFFSTGGSYRHHKGLVSLQTKMEDSLETMRYGKNPRGDGSLKPANFDSQETALQVTMDEPQSLYLKGFTGSLYESGKWRTLPCESYYEETDLFYGLHEGGFYGTTQIQSVTQLMEKEDAIGEIKILNTGASRKYMYYPYELAAEAVDSGKKWSDSFMTTKGIFGEKSYQYTAGTNKTSLWTSLCAEFFNTDDTSDLKQYLINESHYNVQMYQDYTQLTEAQLDLMAEYIGNSGNQTKGHVDYKQAIRRVKKILEDNFIYSESELSGKDPLQTFLKKKKGCDVHYATAATLMYRYYGIPARYVEGYLITPENVEGVKSGETIDIPKANNHAWTEIYIDGFGWIPMEVTPEYYDRMQQPDLSKGLESDKISDAFKNNRNVQQRQQVETEPDAEKTNHNFPWKVILAILIGSLLLVVVITILIRKMRKALEKRKRIQSFHQQDVRAGICAIYRYMLTQQMKISEDAERIGDKAAFSPHEVTEIERDMMLEELQQKERESSEKKNISNLDDGGLASKCSRMWKRKFRR